MDVRQQGFGCSRGGCGGGQALLRQTAGGVLLDAPGGHCGQLSRGVVDDGVESGRVEEAELGVGDETADG